MLHHLAHATVQHVSHAQTWQHLLQVDQYFLLGTLAGYLSFGFFYNRYLQTASAKALAWFYFGLGQIISSLVIHSLQAKHILISLLLLNLGFGIIVYIIFKEKIGLPWKIRTP